MPFSKFAFVAAAILTFSQTSHAEESTLMRDKLITQNRQAMQAERGMEATASAAKQDTAQKKKAADLAITFMN